MEIMIGPGRENRNEQKLQLSMENAMVLLGFFSLTVFAFLQLQIHCIT